MHLDFCAVTSGLGYTAFASSDYIIIVVIIIIGVSKIIIITIIIIYHYHYYYYVHIYVSTYFFLDLSQCHNLSN